ncbi:MAG: alpha/beta hydrolase [Syntrophaceae bacterium]|nr:alpha/beta hydrolase [Syntrophaceae bacterium]
MKVREDVQFSKDSSLLFGEIVSRSPITKPVFAIAYSMDDGRLSVGDYTVLSEPGPYELLVRQGRYRIFAFEDANGNYAYDPGEWAGHYGKGAPLSPQAGGVAWGLDFEISPDGAQHVPPFAGPLTLYSGGKRKHSTSAGALADLDDPSFSAEQGEKAFWEPLDSFQYTGCSIYFLEPYNPQKIPVLFVHGAAGSPQDWKYFLKALDRSRYQPWIFHYPSGARLETTSFFLRKKLYDLYGKYNFDQLFVVAHSMGGLVSRSALIEKDLHNRSVKLFLSISTPWNGEKRAKTGVENSPAVIPSWKDMEPNSDFIRHVFSRKIPDHIRYYLFFGHKGGGSLFRENNDNTVTLESMLDPRAQADALKVMGFNEDHISILSSPEVFQQYEAIAESTEANIKKNMTSSRGYVDVRHSFRPPDTTIPLQMSLVLVPAKGDAQETQFKLNPSTLRQETGAILPGDYEATLCALGFKSEPANLPVSINAGKITDVRYTLIPQGMVAGIITAAAGAADSYWGYFLELSGKHKVRSVTLEGMGIRRSLIPSDGMSEKEVLKTFLSSKDYLSRNGFVFFDLPAGDYTLAIHADGCELYTAKVSVKPGEFTPPPPFRLITK